MSYRILLQRMTYYNKLINMLTTFFVIGIQIAIIWYYILNLGQVNTLPLLTSAMFETKAILSQVTPHSPQAPKQHYLTKTVVSTNRRFFFLTSIACIYKIVYCTSFYRKEYDQRLAKNGNNRV